MPKNVCIRTQVGLHLLDYVHTSLLSQFDKFVDMDETISVVESRFDSI